MGTSRRRGLHRAWSAALVLTVVAVAPGCSNESSSTRIATVQRVDSRTLRVFTYYCPTGTIGSSVEEAPDKVSVRLLYHYNPDHRCNGIVDVALKADLADRSVVDSSTGEVLTVEPDSASG